MFLFVCCMSYKWLGCLINCKNESASQLGKILATQAQILATGECTDVLFLHTLGNAHGVLVRLLTL